VESSGLRPGSRAVESRPRIGYQQPRAALRHVPKFVHRGGSSSDRCVSAALASLLARSALAPQGRPPRAAGAGLPHAECLTASAIKELIDLRPQLVQ